MTEENAMVFIVEDDEAVRDSIELMMESVDQPAKTYVDAQAFLDDYNSSMSGCIVMDVRMPGMNGMELHRRLNELGCNLPIIFVTGHGDIQMAVEAMQNGALDFVTKPYREQELLDTISRALDKDAAKRQFLIEKRVVQERLATLTARETEVMEMMVDGNANKVIGIDLGISERTVEIHRGRVMKKMKTHSLAELVKMVLVAKGRLMPKAV
ncbi:response regulator [uncultured Umboniibacter sp.]|nr:response regulator [uncultured Umboniibacter sp.]